MYRAVWLWGSSTWRKLLTQRDGDAAVDGSTTTRSGSDDG